MSSMYHAPHCPLLQKRQMVAPLCLSVGARASHAKTQIATPRAKLKMTQAFLTTKPLSSTHPGCEITLGLWHTRTSQTTARSLSRHSCSQGAIEVPKKHVGL